MLLRRAKLYSTGFLEKIPISVYEYFGERRDIPPNYNDTNCGFFFVALYASS